MKVLCQWKDRMKFEATTASHTISMDTQSPMGTDTAMTPKQLLLAGVCGCTGMDVVALMRKHKQPLEGLEIQAESQVTTEGHPVVFKSIHLLFKFKGSIEAARAIESVELSQTQYCGVSAMVSKAVPITYSIELNGSPIGSGKSHFNF